MNLKWNLNIKAICYACLIPVGALMLWAMYVYMQKDLVKTLMGFFGVLAICVGAVYILLVPAYKGALHIWYWVYHKCMDIRYYIKTRGRGPKPFDT